MLVVLSFANAVARFARNNMRDVLAIIVGVLLWGAGLFISERAIDEKPSTLIERTIAVTCSIGQEIGLICASAFGGRLASGIIREANIIMPVAFTLAIVDVWGVNLGGPTTHLMKKAHKAFKVATVELPVAGAARVHAPGLLMGFGDLFFAAFLLAVLHRFRLETRMAFWLAASFMAIGMLIVGMVGLAIPGLPFLVIGLLLPNLHRFKFSHQEWRAMLIAGVLLIICLGAISVAINAWGR